MKKLPAHFENVDRSRANFLTRKLVFSDCLMVGHGPLS